MQLVWGAQTLSVSAGWKHFPQQHNAIEVTGVTHGHISLLTADGIWSATTGQVVVIPPLLTHSWVSERGADLVVLHLTQTPKDLANALIPSSYPRVLTLATQMFGNYIAVFERLSSLEGQATQFQERMLHAYIEIFLLLLAEGSGADPNLTATQAIVAYMQEHLQEALTIEALAQQFSVSVSTLRRQFQTTYGISPKQYLLSLRMTEARHLLTSTHLTVQEIAYHVGIPSLPHFSAAIRQHFGTTPTLLRKSARS